MDRNTFSAGASLVVAVICAFAAPFQMRAQDPKTPYPSMAPVDQYLMPDRDAEIALARSAAPDAISRDATILVLGRHGYETAVEGKNGFVCAVERGWTAPTDNLEFWNPKNRSPICYNPPAVRSVLPLTIKRTELVLAGKTIAQIQEWEKAAYAKKDLPTILEPGAMSYMMSKEAYLTDDDGHNLAHLMFYTPVMEKAKWGADVPNSPVILLQTGPPEPFTVFLVLQESGRMEHRRQCRNDPGRAERVRRCCCRSPARPYPAGHYQCNAGARLARDESVGTNPEFCQVLQIALVSA